MYSPRTVKQHLTLKGNNSNIGIVTLTPKDRNNPTMNCDRESRRDRYRRDYFDDMDAFDPFAIEEELRRQAEHAPSEKKNIFLKRLHFKADGIPRTIKFALEKAAPDFKKSRSTGTITSALTEHTTLSADRSSSSCSQSNESFEATPPRRDFREQGKFSAVLEGKSHEVVTPPRRALREQRTRSYSDNQLVQDMNRISSQRRKKLQHRQGTAVRAVSDTQLERVYASSSLPDIQIASDCVRHRSSKDRASTLEKRERKSNEATGPTRKSKYVDLPRESRNKQRERQTSRSPQRASSPALLHGERTGPTDRNSHIKELFGKPTHGGTDCKDGERSKLQSSHRRSEQNAKRQLRRGNSVDRGSHLNSLFDPSGPNITVPPMSRSHSRRRRKRENTNVC